MDLVWLDWNLASTKLTGANPRSLVDQSVPVQDHPRSENLANAVWQMALIRGSQAAVMWHGQPVSYEWIRAAAASVCEYLRSHPKFRSGALVGLALENSPEYLAAYYGVLLADGVVVPVPRSASDGVTFDNPARRHWY
jgi:acyl-CoA synthetase (AMP-forming)/AMP-acid ligase II